MARPKKMLPKIRFELLNLYDEENHLLASRVEHLMDKECGGCAGDYVMRAYLHHSLQLVGLWSFTLDGEWINSNGTWVHSKWRKHGVGTLLWKRGLARFPGIKEVYLQTTSSDGVAFTKRLKERFPSYEFFVEDVSGHDAVSCEVG